MSTTRLTCKKCQKEFDYSAPVSCEECRIHISPLTCLTCHNKSHNIGKRKILVLKYRRIAGIQMTGIFAWCILAFSFGVG